MRKGGEYIFMHRLSWEGIRKLIILYSPGKECPQWVWELGGYQVTCAAQPKLSSLKQPPFYPAHISVSWLDWRGLLYVVIAESPEAKDQAQCTHTFKPLLPQYLLKSLWPKQFTRSTPNLRWRNRFRFLMGGATKYSAHWFEPTMRWGRGREGETFLFLGFCTF